MPAFRDIARAIKLREQDFFPANGQYTSTRPKPPEFKDDDEFLDFLDDWTFYLPDGILCDVAAKQGVNVEPYGVANLRQSQELQGDRGRAGAGVQGPSGCDRREPGAQRGGVRFPREIAIADWPFFSSRDDPVRVTVGRTATMSGESVKTDPNSGGKSKRQK